MNTAKNMDSVFACCAEDELEFDTMFDQEDSLIDTINGVNEAGDPLTGVDFVDLHQDHDEADVDDVKDVRSDDEPMGVKDAEGTEDPEQLDTSVKGEVGKESDADKLYGDSEEKYQEDKEKEPKPDASEVEKTIEDVVEASAYLEEETEEVTPDIEAELKNEEQAVKESDDSDIIKMLDADDDDDTEIVEKVEADSASEKYAYDISDEDLIDAAINGED